MSASTTSARPLTAPYGTWASPISARQLAAGAKPLSSPRVYRDPDGRPAVCWLEGLTTEQGRVVVARPAGRHDAATTPAPFNVRSRVNEYGGGAYAVAGDTVWFSNFADNHVYAQTAGQTPRALTTDRRQRFADFEPDLNRRRLIAVGEDHSTSDHEPANRLVAFGIDVSADTTPTAPVVLTEGFDFYAAPRLSPDGRRLAWICWNHPRMPWNGTELWLADVDQTGALSKARKVAGGDDEALCQPSWSPDGELFVVSDRSGWWNLYRLADTTAPHLEAIAPMAAEFGRPQWVFGQSMYGFIAERQLVATCIDQGVSRLLRLDLDGAAGWQPIDTPYTDINELRAGPGFIVMLAGAAHLPEQVVRLELPLDRPDSDDDQHPVACQVLALSVGDLGDGKLDAYLSKPESIRYASAAGRHAFAFFYPPRNADYQAPAAERPPLIVTSHGGPTSMSTSSLRLAIQYWTSRGFAVLDVNYGGSSGYGRDYRNLLAGTWGIVDVEDCVAGARHLADRALVDADRMAIRGGSASGFTTLCALTFHRVFKAGASYYGVSDLAALDADTHKFESHYTSYLVAPPPRREELYRQRSPILHTDRLSCPMIFFQGKDDKVVPLAQSESMVAALKARQIPVAYLAFDGEGHGFRQADTIRRTLEAELYFYARVFGFQQADVIEPIQIEGL